MSKAEVLPDFLKGRIEHADVQSALAQLGLPLVVSDSSAETMDLDLDGDDGGQLGTSSSHDCDCIGLYDDEHEQHEVESLPQNGDGTLVPLQVQVPAPGQAQGQLLQITPHAKGAANRNAGVRGWNPRRASCYYH